MLFLDQEVLHVTVTIFLAHLVDLMAPLVSFSEYLFADFFAPQNMLHFLRAMDTCRTLRTLRTVQSNLVMRNIYLANYLALVNFTYSILF